MDPIFKRLIDIASAALEAEDRLFLDGVSANQKACPGEKGGILRIDKEKYYQFIVARALASSFPYPADVEVGYYDLVLRHPGDPFRSDPLQVVRGRGNEAVDEFRRQARAPGDKNEHLCGSKPPRTGTCFDAHLLGEPPGNDKRAFALAF